jgi:hypothetical protein
MKQARSKLESKSSKKKKKTKAYARTIKPLDSEIADNNDQRKILSTTCWYYASISFSLYV